jgi:hypothetical protein
MHPRMSPELWIAPSVARSVTTSGVTVGDGVPFEVLKIMKAPPGNPLTGVAWDWLPVPEAGPESVCRETLTPAVAV